jgi:hypothetical protein
MYNTVQRHDILAFSATAFFAKRAVDGAAADILLKNSPTRRLRKLHVVEGFVRSVSCSLGQCG